MDDADVLAVNSKQHRSLYIKREKIHPKAVQGFYRRLKWGVMLVTLGIYYLMPWIRWERGDHAPGQAVLLDIEHRRFYFFFIEIWPQEIWVFTALLIIAAMALFLANTVAGRVWCGYTCPQTVWTDLFIAVERLVEGDRAARIRLDKAPNSVPKLARRATKHGIWLLVAMMTGGAWVFYFADAPTLAAELVTGRAAGVAYATVAILTFTTYALGGLMREQVCTYMCPWPRIQGAMLDDESMVVTYRAFRGEPRGAGRREAGDAKGDCVDCKQCIAACPMAIDIRDGQQLECITCGLCLDACDSVMDKVGRPRGLIAYDTLRNLDRRAKGLAPSLRLLRPRSVLYALVILLVGALLVYALATRAPFDINVLHDRNPLFVPLSDGGIRNGYVFKILNKRHQAAQFGLGVDGLAGARITSVVGADAADDADAPQGEPRFSVPPDRLRSFKVYVAAPRDGLAASGHQPIDFILTDLTTQDIARYDSVFRGPGK